MRSIKNFLPHSLLGRSLLILVTPILIIQAFTVFIFLDRHWDTMTQRLAYALAGEVAIITDRYDNNPHSESSELIQNYAEEYLGLDVSFHAGKNINVEQEIYRGWGQVVYKSLSMALVEDIQKEFRVEISMQEKWAMIYIQLDDGVLKIWCPIRRLFSSSGYIFLLWVMGSSLVMLVVAILFMRNQIRPIKRLAIAADRFGRGQDAPSLKPSGAKEVRAATRAFLRMKQRIDRHIQQRTSMLAGVSHDLRTPLTRMKVQLSMMEGQGDVKGLLEDAKDMERMIDAYLEFVRGEGDEAVQMTAVAGFLSDIVQKSERSGVVIESNVDADFSLPLKSMAIERAIHNVIVNADKYGEHVWLTAGVDEEGKRLNVKIDDDGPGIEEGLFEEVFKPFYRIEESRNQSTGGSGLGLPIAQSIVHAHGGEVALSKSDKGGLSVLITLPLSA